MRQDCLVGTFQRKCLRRGNHTWSSCCRRVSCTPSNIACLCKFLRSRTSIRPSSQRHQNTFLHWRNHTSLGNYRAPFPRYCKPWGNRTSSYSARGRRKTPQLDPHIPSDSSQFARYIAYCNHSRPACNSAFRIYDTHPHNQAPDHPSTNRPNCCCRCRCWCYSNRSSLLELRCHKQRQRENRMPK